MGGRRGRGEEERNKVSHPGSNSRLSSQEGIG